MKGNLSRLAPALLREIEAAQDRRRHKRATGAMQYLAAIVESSEDAIYGKNLNSLIVSWNPAAERLFGFSTEEIVGQSVQKLYPRHLQDEMLDILGSVRRGDTIGIRETERLHKSGQIIPVAVTISPIRDSSGEIIGASTIARDISPQKKAELEKQKLMQRLEARAKRAAKAEDSDDPERVRPSSEEASDGQDPDAATVPKLKNSAYAGFCSGGWKVFDTFEEAHSYAREWVAHQPAAEYKIYNVLREMVGKVVSGDALGNSADKRKEPQQKTWWKFWR
jgi:PAS domain S-box-containing protein